MSEAGVSSMIFAQRFLLPIAVTLLVAVWAQVQPPARADAVAQAQAVIKQARAAMGGEAAFDAIQTLSASGKYHRTVTYVSVQSPTKVIEKEKRMGGKVEIEFALPDKFRKRTTEETLRGFGFAYAQIVNGSEAWRDPPLRAISSHNDNRVIDVSDFQRTELMSAQGARQQLTFFALGWLLQPLQSFPLKLRYEGVFETDQGKGKANAIIAEGQGGFRIAWLFDVATHLPVAIAIGTYEARQMPVISEAIGFFDRRFMQETFARVRRERQARMKPAAQHEVEFRFSDRRPVAGVSFPHRITTTIDGEVFEETVFDDFEINRSINPKKFKGPPKPKE